MASITVQPHQMLERILSLEIVRVTERAAVSAARLRGRGNEKAADQAAVDAMRRELNKLPIHGTVVIGEGERDEAPMLFIGEEVGQQDRHQGRYRGRSAGRHHALRQEHAGRDRHHGDGGGRHAAQRPRRLHGQDRDRPRLSQGRRRSRCAGRRQHRQARQGEGRQAGRHHRAHPRPAAPCRPDRRGAQDRRGGRPHHRRRRRRRDPHRRSRDATGIDIYMGIGGAPEGVLAAAALRCIGGQMQGRLVLDTEEKRERAAKMGIKDPRKKYEMEDMVRGDCLFAATGVTTGSMLRGVRFRGDRHRDRDRGDALGDRHGALDPRRASAAREVPPGLTAPRDSGDSRIGRLLHLSDWGQLILLLSFNAANQGRTDDGNRFSRLGNFLSRLGRARSPKNEWHTISF